MRPPLHYRQVIKGSPILGPNRTLKDEINIVMISFSNLKYPKMNSNSKVNSIYDFNYDILYMDIS